MKLKDGVNPSGIRPELLLALVIADRVWIDNAHNLVVTSLNDGFHSATSLHYDGSGADLRTWEWHDGTQWSDTKKQRIAQELRNSLSNNPDYDVIVEDDHIHLEYQPKRRT